MRRSRRLVQVAALVALVGIAGGPEAGLLGSAWVVVLRTLSQLDLLQAVLTRRALDKKAAEVQHRSSCSVYVIRGYGGTWARASEVSPAQQHCLGHEQCTEPFVQNKCKRSSNRCR
jgi:hypothetical protein